MVALARAVTYFSYHNKKDYSAKRVRFDDVDFRLDKVCLNLTTKSNEIRFNEIFWLSFGFYCYP